MYILSIVDKTSIVAVWQKYQRHDNFLSESNANEVGTR